MTRSLLLLLSLLLVACPSGRGGGGGDDDDSAGGDDDDATPEGAWADDSEVLASITHRADDPCPHPLGTLWLRNPTDEALDFSVAQGGNVNGQSVLTYSDEPFDGEDGEALWLGTLPAATDFALNVGFNCSDLVSTTTTITGSINLVGYEVAIAIDVE